MPTRSTPPADLISAPAQVRQAVMESIETPQTAPTTEPAWRSHEAKPAQLNYIKDLRVRLTDPAHLAWLDAELEKGLTKGRAHDIIDRLKALPRPTIAKEATTAPQVPEGRYALPEPTDALNPVRFYTVDHGKVGTKWAGFMFVSRHASDDRYPVKGKERYRVLEAIAADTEAASRLYGHETGHCGVCGKELTREESRAKGIGPICEGKQGWA